ncbi:MAG: hypothetical protein SFV54_09690 [Bryobacteraceae bacterium]|nr:hypothetical protein [Bryobacteraceae bacterium]
MSLGLQLRTETTPPGVPLTLTHQLLAEWFRRECDHVLRGVNLRDEDGVETLFVELHPAAEDLRLWFENGTEVVVSAQTSSAGPGYHVYVCDLLLSMAGEFGFRWKADSEEDFDETGYFESRDAGALCKEMLAWLSAVCTSVLDESHDECAGLLIAMPWGVSYKVDQFLITAMGPRSRTWTESVARDPNAGTDFFAWWTPGFTAEYYLRRAICLMWNSVRWRPPLTDDERRVLSEVRENLEAAHKLDDSLDYPWREWSELIGFLHTEADFPSLKEVRDSNAPLIGYRRNPVRVALSGGCGLAPRFETNG